jgi:hypothetical protein
MSEDPLRQRVIAAIDRELQRQAEAYSGAVCIGGYIGGPLPVQGGFPASYDGDLYLGELADAVLAAMGGSGH